jgi:hypothetical protein
VIPFEKDVTAEPGFCSHPLNDHEEVIMRVEIKDFRLGRMTVVYTYRCYLHPGKCGSFTVTVGL